MKSCERRRTIAKRSLAELDEEELSSLWSHARTCADCREGLDALSMAERVFADAVVAGPAEHVRDAMWRNIAHARVEPVPARRLLPALAFAVAAAFFWVAIRPAFSPHDEALEPSISNAASRDLTTPDVATTEFAKSDFDPGSAVCSEAGFSSADAADYGPLSRLGRNLEPQRTPRPAQNAEKTEDPEALLNAADELRRSGKVDAAAAIYRRVAALPRAEAYAEEAMLREARIDAQLAQNQEALAVLSRARARFPRGALAPERAAFAARLHLEANDPNAAAEVLEAEGCDDAILQRARTEVAAHLAEPVRARALVACVPVEKN